MSEVKEFVATCITTCITIVILLSLAFLPIAGCMRYYPTYKVWKREMDGKATLQESTYSRRVKVEESKAVFESSKSLALAEIERAKGVAEANKIIGDSLKNNESYLRYLYIQGLQDKDNNVIYVPTEAGLPILEAGKR